MSLDPYLQVRGYEDQDLGLVQTFFRLRGLDADRGCGLTEAGDVSADPVDLELADPGVVGEAEDDALDEVLVLLGSENERDAPLDVRAVNRGMIATKKSTL